MDKTGRVMAPFRLSVDIELDFRDERRGFVKSVKVDRSMLMVSESGVKEEVKHKTHTCWSQVASEKYSWY